MKKEKESYIIKKFLKEKSHFILHFLFIVCILFSLAAIYGYENSIKNMFYGVIIVSFFEICFGMRSYISYRKKYKQLLQALSNNGESDYHLTEPASLEEALYQEIIYSVEEEKRELLFDLDERKRDMSDYYTMWIHQIKTPIAALQLLLQREVEISDSGIGRRAEEELFKIEQYSEMALHYARLDSMSSDMLLQTYDISTILKRAVKKYAVLFIGSSLAFSLEEFECRAVTDEKWLAFVIEQVLSNAIKYTKKGGIRIYGIDERGRECVGEVTCIIIEDTGIGINESDLPRIFERGFTGYNGRMSQKSTGIGLYLCRQIMTKLGHDIRVESEMGKGSRVLLEFKQTRME